MMNDIEKEAIERFKEVLQYRNTEILYPSDCTLAIEALQEKQERDKMRCENCSWFEQESFFADDEAPMSEQTYYTCTFYGDDVPGGIPASVNHFCSCFEPKENEKMSKYETAIAAFKSDNDYRNFEIDKWCKIADPNKKENLVIKEQEVYMFRGMMVTGENALNAIQAHHGRIENNNTAIEALQAQAERDNPQPLTLKQLKQRDGKPVWCSKNKQYGIVDMTSNKYLNISFTDGWEALISVMAKPIYECEPKQQVK